MSPKPNWQCDVHFVCLNYFAGDMELGIEYFFAHSCHFVVVQMCPSMKFYKIIAIANANTLTRGIWQCQWNS